MNTLLNRIHRYGYQIAGNGRWVSLTLRKPKKAGGNSKKTKMKPVATEAIDSEDAQESDGAYDDITDPVSRSTSSVER